ncbi:MAG: DEAD/DEAH box helicase [Armatimonadota bacterium]|nr:DEAD/DEAH box helicase [bacterium]
MTSETTSTLSPGDKVQHSRYGSGTVVQDNGPTVIVRFIHGIEECEKQELRLLEGPLSKALSQSWDVPLEVINKIQADCITSVNDTWGVFSVSRIELLPHQLWVCRKVNSIWPTRWLVADDVGLGKTIEAGMILWPLLAKGVVNRLLILCPASLVEQWQYRMRTMFDIRMAMYGSEQDGPRSGFWQTHDRVVASIHTLRMDQNGRLQRMLEAEPWDLVIVDEAHHLNNDEHAGPTLSYKLIRQLQDRKLIRSMLFFTGTPHRGKNYGFFSLLQLLKPDWFDPRKPPLEQMRYLPDVMIRNNKSGVTDLTGKKLFQKPLVTSHTYSYNPEEARFYELLTEFIATGRAYASGLESTEGRAVVLVLIAMQKLASSSVAAVRRALRGRRERLTAGKHRLALLKDQMAMLSDPDADGDVVATLEEQIASLSSGLRLMENEAPFLDELIAAADKIHNETKIKSIVEIIRERCEGQQVLFFTEYKATQSLLMTALLKEYGSGCVTFINGDERAEEVIFPDGTIRSVVTSREEAASLFNAGRVKFLISTEAGGEGIDLQEQCHTLIHVDLPWNPMRLHQRVGRLNRYGQKHRVEVMSFRNPDTVESLIWEKLNEKLERISRALGLVMEEPEDLLQLVLGMTSPSLFNEVFSEAANVKRDSLSEWFDDKTATFGGDDVVRAVKEITGNVSKYDYQNVSPLLPRVDLPDLRPFLEMSLALNGRRLRDESGELSFLTPDEWRKNDPLVPSEYRGFSVDRQNRSKQLRSEILGIGHRALNAALNQASSRQVSATTIPAELLPLPVVVFRIQDRVTTGHKSCRAIVAAVECESESSYRLLLDWELLLKLNALPRGRQSLASAPSISAPAVEDTLNAAERFLAEEISRLDHGYKYPRFDIVALLWPRSEQ